MPPGMGACLVHCALFDGRRALLRASRANLLHLWLSVRARFNVGVAPIFEPAPGLDRVGLVAIR